MSAAVRYAVEHLEIARDEALRMASLYPATFLRLDGAHGRFARGYAADIVHLDENLEVRGTWVAGARTPA